ncbi:MAG: UPF0104 family protein [Hydrogenophaga sp.]|nr:UPF0104 family protein [Hydrogenophaga sp.]
MKFKDAMWRVLPWVFGLGVLGLVGYLAREVEWADVWQSLRRLSPWVVAASALLALLTHAIYASFDLVGRRLTPTPRLGWPRTLQVAAISYSFNINLGAVIGGLGMRMRLYTRLGLSAATVAQIAAHSVLTNWLGWCWLAGAVLLFAPPRLAAPWAPGAPVLQGVGAVLLLALSYHAVCTFSRRSSLRWRTHVLQRPGARLALLQAMAGTLPWLLMALSLWNLLEMRVPYPQVLSAVLLAAVAGVVLRVPGGLGVFETVAVAALARSVPVNEVLAAVLAYRATHYLWPLALALPAYAYTEMRAARAVRAVG